MDISKFLGKVIGIYLIIISVAMLVNMQQFTNDVNNLIHDRTLMFVTGFFTLILGILVVVAHNIWKWNWRVIITIIAWISLIKGMSLIFYPQLIDQTAMIYLQNVNMAYVAAIVDLILGLILFYFGFKKD